MATKIFEAAGADSVEDLGRVVAINQPEHVSWLEVGCLVLTDYGLYKPEEGHTYLSTVPVSTSELLKAKNGCGPLETDDFFWVKVNIDATSRGDVMPEVVSFSNVSPEILEDF